MRFIVSDNIFASSTESSTTRRIDRPGNLVPGRAENRSALKEFGISPPLFNLTLLGYSAPELTEFEVVVI